MKKLILFFLIFSTLLLCTSIYSCPLYSGQGNYALCFDYDTWVVLPQNLSAALGPEMTFEVWIQTDVIQSQFGPTPEYNDPYYRLNLNRPIVSRYRTDIQHPNNVLNDFNLQIIPEGQLGFFMGGGADFTDNFGNQIPIYGVNFLCNLTLESFRWYHIAFTIYYDNTILPMFPLAVRIQVDWDFTTLNNFFEHIEPWDNSRKARRNYLVSESIVLGGYNNSDPLWPEGQYFVGIMDEVRFWQGTRNSSELYGPPNYYANRTVGGQEPWLVTPQATLIASYNFNEGNGSILHSQYGSYDGIIYTTRTEPNYWCLSQVEIITYIYVKAGLDPPQILVPLYGHDVQGFPFQYFVTFIESQVGGNLYQYNGSAIQSGDQVIVNGTQAYLYYQLTATESGVYQFSYYITDGHCISFSGRETIVRIVVDCCYDCTGCRIDCKYPNPSIKKWDACGVCGGNNSTCTGCDGVINSGKVYDACGVCGGNNSTCTGCDGVVNSGKVYDACGVCGGNNTSLQICGCNDNTSCIGCDGVPYSGRVYDICGVCGGNNGSCVGCDGSGGGVYDICGVCGGDNSTCGGCDGKGSQYDICGVCGGDNSTCTCVLYKGFDLRELDYVLLQWTINHTLSEIDVVLKLISQTLNLMECYEGDIDFAAILKFFSGFRDSCLKDYLTAVILNDNSQQIQKLP